MCVLLAHADLCTRDLFGWVHRVLRRELATALSYTSLLFAEVTFFFSRILWTWRNGDSRQCYSCSKTAFFSGVSEVSGTKADLSFASTAVFFRSSFDERLIKFLCAVVHTHTRHIDIHIRFYFPHTQESASFVVEV
jgi:hypothetical protein